MNFVQLLLSTRIRWLYKGLCGVRPHAYCSRGNLLTIDSEGRLCQEFSTRGLPNPFSAVVNHAVNFF